MSPLPPIEQPPHEPEGHKQPVWPWETESKKPVEKEENKKDKKEPKKEKEDKPKHEKTTQEKEPQKTPEEKRSGLIEQALELVAKHEEEPIPRDAPTLARVMIAHRVVHLYEQLQHPDQLPEDTSIETIEATLDYIVQLDDKFNDPSIETTPEIEASYHEILELAEATLREEPHLEKVVADINNDPNDTAQQRREPDSNFSTNPRQKVDNNEQKPDPIQEEFDRRKTALNNTLAPLAAATALIYSITRLGRKKQKKQQAEATGSSSDTRGIPQDTVPPSSEFTPPASSSADQSPAKPSSMPRPEASFAPGSLPERDQPLPSREYNPISPRRHSSAPVAAAAIATTLAVSRSPERKQTPTPTSPNYTAPLTETFTGQQHPETPAPERITGSDRKIEHMPLLQLLSMAEGIPLGHGRYLRQEFEAGKIDKDGLIKILKARSKGRDYQWEFREQAAQFAALKATSPEFLHNNQATNDRTTPASPVDAVAKPTSEERSAFNEEKPSSQPISLAPPRGDHPLLPKFAGRIQPKPRTAQRIAVITAVAIGGLIGVSLLTGAIFAWLS